MTSHVRDVHSSPPLFGVGASPSSPELELTPAQPPSPPPPPLLFQRDMPADMFATWGYTKNNPYFNGNASVPSPPSSPFSGFPLSPDASLPVAAQVRLEVERPFTYMQNGQLAVMKAKIIPLWIQDKNASVASVSTGPHTPYVSILIKACLSSSMRSQMRNQHGNTNRYKNRNAAAESIQVQIRNRFNNEMQYDSVRSVSSSPPPCSPLLDYHPSQQSDFLDTPLLLQLRYEYLLLSRVETRVRQEISSKVATSAVTDSEAAATNSGIASSSAGGDVASAPAANSLKDLQGIFPLALLTTPEFNMAVVYACPDELMPLVQHQAPIAPIPEEELELDDVIPEDATASNTFSGHNRAHQHQQLHPHPHSLPPHPSTSPHRWIELIELFQGLAKHLKRYHSVQIICKLLNLNTILYSKQPGTFSTNDQNLGKVNVMSSQSNYQFIFLDASTFTLLETAASPDYTLSDFALAGSHSSPSTELIRDPSHPQNATSAAEEGMEISGPNAGPYDKSSTHGAAASSHDPTLSPGGTSRSSDETSSTLAKILQQNDASSTDTWMSASSLQSLYYLSPECTGRMGSSHTIDNRSDLYSLGCVYYQLLTGQPVTFEGIRLVQERRMRSKKLKAMLGADEEGLEGQLLEILHCHLSKMPTPPAALVQKRAQKWIKQHQHQQSHELATPSTVSASPSSSAFSAGGFGSLSPSNATPNVPQLFSSRASISQIQSVIAVLNSVILKLLSKSVHQRYQSCIGLMFDIDYCEAILNARNETMDSDQPNEQQQNNNNTNDTDALVTNGRDHDFHAASRRSPTVTDGGSSLPSEFTQITGGTHTRTDSLSSFSLVSSQSFARAPNMSTATNVSESNSDRSQVSDIPISTATSATTGSSFSLPTPSRRLRIQSDLDGNHILSSGLTMSTPTTYRHMNTPHRFESKNVSIGDFRVSQCIYGRDESQQELLQIFNRICLPEFSRTPDSIDIQHVRDDATSSAAVANMGNSASDGPSIAARDCPRVIARPELVLISGFSGIGKTSLIDVVQAPMLKARALFGRGKFDLYKRDSSIIFQSFEQLILYIMTRAPNEREYWKRELQGALQDEAQVVIDLIPILGVLLGPQLPVVPMPPIDTQRRLTNRLTHFIRVFARLNHPLVLFADDLQWADQHTIAILRILFQLEHVHMLILGAYRDNEVDEAHPLTKFIQQLQETEKETRVVDQQQMDELKLPNKPQLPARITTVHLGPLQLKDINHMVADTLHCNMLMESGGGGGSNTASAASSSSSPLAPIPNPPWAQMPLVPDANQGARLNAYALPLSQYLLKKTSGNPFYVNQLLKALYLTQQYFRFDFECRCWRYDIVSIESAPLSGDIIDIISMQIKALAPTAVKLICIMSCVGNQATLQQLLQTIRMDEPLTTESQVAKDVWETLQSGFLVALDAAFISQLFILAFEPSASEPSTTGLNLNDLNRLADSSVTMSAASNSSSHVSQLLKMKFRFLHDRVQQSAYSLLQPAERIKIHLSIGRGALAQLQSNGIMSELETEMVKCVPGKPQTTSRVSGQQASAASTSLPDIAGHFSHCVELISSDGEIRDLVLVCISAGRKAKICTAYDAALKFSKLALRILEDRMANFWSMKDKTDGRVSVYELALIIHLLMAEAYFQIDFDACNQTIQQALAHVDNSPENLLARVAFHELIQFAELTQNRYLSSLNTGLETLQLLNYSFPPLSECELALKDEEGFYQRMLAIVEQAPQRSATDPTDCAIARVSLSVLSAAYFLNHETFCNVCYGALKHAGQVGPTPMMSFALSFFTHICHKYQMLDLCYRIGCLAKTCVERYGLEAQPFRVRVYSSFSVAVSHWRGSVHAALKPIEAANSMCLEAGDLEYWSYTSFFGLDALFYAGRSALETVEQAQKVARKTYQRKKLPVALTYLNLWRICIAKLIGKMSEDDEEMYEDEDAADEEKSSSDTNTTANSTSVDKGRATFTHSQLMAPLRAANAVTFLFAGYAAEFTFGYFSRQFERVVPLVKECFDLPDWKQNGLVVIPPAVFYAGLSLLASVNQSNNRHPSNADPPPDSRSDPSVARDRVLDAMPLIELMRSWAKFARVNYWHKYQLMEAERMHAEIFSETPARDEDPLQSRIQLEFSLATPSSPLIFPCLQLYSEAIAGAVENQFSQDEIIANELCARYCLRIPLLYDCASKYVKAAYVASVRWGCRMKMTQLSEQFPQFIRQRKEVGAITAGGESSIAPESDKPDPTRSEGSALHYSRGEEQPASTSLHGGQHEPRDAALPEASDLRRPEAAASVETTNSVDKSTSISVNPTATNGFKEDNASRLDNHSSKLQQHAAPSAQASNDISRTSDARSGSESNTLEVLPVLPRPIPMMSRLHLTTTTPSSLDRHLDSVAIMRACMTFSAETNLDRLLTRVMHLVITYSSATKGVFLLNQLPNPIDRPSHPSSSAANRQPHSQDSDDSPAAENRGSTGGISVNASVESDDLSADPLSKWNVRLIATSEDGFDDGSSRSSLAPSRRNSKEFALGSPATAAFAANSPNHHMLKIASSPASLPQLSSGLVLPLSVLNLASTTGSVCVMSGADLQQDSFRQDAYLQRYSPPSVLLLPIVWQTKTLGMLYLENAYRESAFSSSIIHCVQLISVQAALSIENARITARLQSSMLDAQRATRAKSDFINSMSHELRTPLNAVIGVTRLLGETDLSEEQTSLLHIIHSSSKLLLGIISDILDFSRLEAGKVELDEQVVSSLNCIENAVHLCSEIAAQKGLELVYFLQPGVPAYVKLDHTHMQQVLLNLISNALKFSQKGVVQVNVGVRPANTELDANMSAQASHVSAPEAGNPFSSAFEASKQPVCESLHSSADEDEVTLEISVSDSGCGIPSDALPHLFHSFTQADSSIRRTHGGAGLGLAIAKRIVEAMNGRIWITSTVGVGTTVSFTVRVKIPSLVDMKEVWRTTRGEVESFRYEPRQALYAAAIQPSLTSPSNTMRSLTASTSDITSIIRSKPSMPNGGILLVCNSLTQPGARAMLESLLLSALPSALSLELANFDSFAMHRHPHHEPHQQRDVVCVDTIEAAGRAWHDRRNQSTPFYAVVLHVERVRENHSIHQMAQLNVDSLLRAFESFDEDALAGSTKVPFNHPLKLLVTGARWKPQPSSSAAAANATGASVATFTDESFSKFDMDRNMIAINNASAIVAPKGISLTEQQYAWWPMMQIRLLLLPFRHREMIQLLIEPVPPATRSAITLMQPRSSHRDSGANATIQDTSDTSPADASLPNMLHRTNINHSETPTSISLQAKSMSMIDVAQINLDNRSSSSSSSSSNVVAVLTPTSLPPVTPGAFHRSTREFAKRITNIQSQLPFELMLVEDNAVNIKMMTMLLAKLGWSLGVDGSNVAINGIICLEKIDKALTAIENQVDNKNIEASTDNTDSAPRSASGTTSASPLSSSSGPSMNPLDPNSSLMQLVRTHHLPQVILMDISMDGLDGITCTERIVQNFNSRYIALGLPTPYVIACTANVTRENRKHCADAGMEGFIPKPVSLELLITCLTRAGGHVFKNNPES